MTSFIDFHFKGDHRTLHLLYELPPFKFYSGLFMSGSGYEWQNSVTW